MMMRRRVVANRLDCQSIAIRKLNHSSISLCCLCDVITPGASPGVVQQGATLRDSRARITLSGNSKPTHYDYKQVCLQYNWRLMAQQQNALVFNNIAVFPY